MNIDTRAMYVFGDYLYTALNKGLSQIFLSPKGCELVRIDKEDYWELIVSSDPIQGTQPKTGSRKPSLSGYEAGFNNKYNIIIWNMIVLNKNKENEKDKDKLLVMTFEQG